MNKTRFSETAKMGTHSKPLFQEKCWSLTWFWSFWLSKILRYSNKPVPDSFSWISEFKTITESWLKYRGLAILKEFTSKLRSRPRALVSATMICHHSLNHCFGGTLICFCWETEKRDKINIDQFRKIPLVFKVVLFGLTLSLWPRTICIALSFK